MDNLQCQKFVLRIKPIENGELLAEVVGPVVAQKIPSKL